ncbi:hypothetical protein FACS1894184_16930 [Clostridia bacterium]|nr:hypothetical protein FACS1894184_16930 [Clostridia bacterium]
MKPHEFLKKAKELGWKFNRHGKEHDEYIHDTMPGVLMIPRHARELKTGTLNQLMKTAGLK